MSKEKKYTTTGETRIIDGHVLYRIKALKDFDDVKVGDLGGFIEYEHNLSHLHNGWIYYDAAVYEHARVHHAKIKGKIAIGGQSIVWKDYDVSKKAKIYKQSESIYIMRMQSQYKSFLNNKEGNKEQNNE